MSKENIRLQAEEHPLVPIAEFEDPEQYCIFLMHQKAYENVIDIVKDKRVLDLGCNNGYGTALLKPHCRSIIGVDVSEKAVEEARRLYGEKGVEFKVVDGKNLPFKDGDFDVVTSFQVIEHISDYESYLSEIKRVLSSGGQAFMTTPNAVIRLDPGMKPWNRFHVKEFEAGSLEQLLRNYFSGVKVYGLFAKEDTYNVELNRVQSSRKIARLYKHFPFLRLKDIPPFSYLKQTLGRVSRKGRPAINVYEKYSTQDFYYQDCDLEKALDLLAVCHK